MTPALTCKQFIEFLDEYLGGEQPGDVREEFERHLACCRHCADFLRTYRDTIALGKGAFASEQAAVPPGVPEDLIRAVMSLTTGAGAKPPAH